MLSMALQWLFTLALAAVPPFALMTAAERSGNRFHLAAWRVTGMAFLLFACCLLAQQGWASGVYGRAEESPAMRSYLAWQPAFEHSRTVLMVGAAVMLGVLALRRREPGRGFFAATAVVLAVAMLAGVAGGVVEGPFQTLQHLTNVALTDATELILLMVTLFVLLVTNRVDRYLWSLLAVYGASVALGVPWLAWVAPVDTQPDAWHPPYWTLAAVRVVLYGTMAAIAFRRWRVGRRGRPMRGMLGPERVQLSALR